MKNRFQAQPVAFSILLNRPIFRDGLRFMVMCTALFLGILSVPTQAQLTQSSLTLSFDANQDLNANTIWESLTANSTRDWTLGASINRIQSTTLGTSLDTGGILGITAAYQFPGLSSTNLVDERASAATYQGLGDTADASLEFWIRLDDTATDQVIWESGGATNGSSLVLIGGQLQFTSKTNPASEKVSIAAPTDGQFHQIFVTIDLDASGTNDLLSIYLDAGTPVTISTATGITSWSGSDVAGLGGYNNALGADASQGLVQNNFQNTLAAGIASMRYYQTALSAAEVLANYNAVTATTVFFDNEAADGLWSGQTNWDTNIQPTSAQAVIINNGANVTVHATGETAGSLTIGSTAASSLVPSVISGAGTLTLTGGDLTVSGTLTLGDGENGTLNLSGGVLNMNGDIAAGSGATSTLNLNGGTLNMNGHAIGSVGSSISSLNLATGVLDSVAGINGSVGLVKSTVGTLTLTGTNTYAGGTIISNGTLAVGSTDALSVVGTITVNTGGTLDLGGFNSTAGTIVLAGGVINGSGALSSTADFDLQSGRVNAVLDGSASLTKSTSGVVMLNNSNSFTGATTINGGTLIAGDTSALASSSGISVLSGGHLNFFTGAGNAAMPYSVAITGLNLADGSSIGGELGGGFTTGAATVAGTISVDVYGSPGVASPGGSTFTLVTAASGLDNATAYQIGNVFNNTNFTVSTANLTTSATQIQVTPQSATALTAAYWKGGYAGGANVWAVSNGSTTSNWTTDAAGTTATGLVPGVGADVTISATGATNQSSMVLGADMAINTLTITDTATTSLDADGHTLTIGNSAGSTGITVSAGAGTAAINADLVLNGTSPTITHGGANDFTIGGVISGSGGLIKNGSGTLILSADNIYTGDTNINGGTVQVGDGGISGTLGVDAGTINVGNATLIFNRADGVTIADDINFSLSGATLWVMQGVNTLIGGTVGNLDVSQNVLWTIDSGAVLNVNANGSASNIGMGAGFTLTLDGAGYGTINRSLASGTAAANVVKNGAGTWEFTNSANNFAGSTTVNDGVLFLNATGGGGLNNTSGLTINGGTVFLGQSNQIANNVTVTIAGAGAVLDLGTNHTDRVATFTLAGGGTITGLGTSALTVNAGDTFELQNGTVNVVLTGTAGLNKTSTGTATINVVATYTGETNIASGTLLLDLGTSNIGVINGSSGLTVSGGRLLIQGQAGGGNVSSETLGNLTLTANTSSIIAIDSNTGDSTTLDLGSVWDRGANSFLVINYTAANGSSFVNTGADVTGSGAMTGGIFSMCLSKTPTAPALPPPTAASTSCATPIRPCCPPPTRTPPAVASTSPAQRRIRLLLRHADADQCLAAPGEHPRHRRGQRWNARPEWR
ncbi:MAG: autotransporter-associated beta strand repeat-containing protein [Prosthecobacter sp.]